ncbi:MAG: hypothetical protein RMJ43_10510 [Chloroherpetonaceae bacterium]|nr:hypothetical protein [Chthonomonadaceae bacterium]MDW8208261.1 hypothetical protein [Chloroherpetonaceae bacterium]
MSPGKDYAPCPHCAAQNITHRHVCWRCGSVLPYTIGLDGQPHANVEAWSRTVSKAEIERLLDQAQTFDLEEERRRQEAKEPFERLRHAFRPRLWRWLRRGAERSSSA